MQENTINDMQHKLFLYAILLLFTFTARGQVKLSPAVEQTGQWELTLTFKGTIDEGWHLASDTVIFEECDGVRPIGLLQKTDKDTYTLKMEIQKRDYHVKGYMEYTACSDTMCHAPERIDFEGGESTGLLQLFLIAFTGGLLALLTPCIWPIIPLTVSFFIKRGKGITGATTYGLSIIAIFVGLGLILTLLFGANALNEMSTNAVFNIVCALVLIVFGVSLMGVFELRLPSSVNNIINDKAEKTTGFVSIFLLALTLVVVSFSCTAPIVGLLLVEVADKGGLLAPLTGMFGFSLALALPFTIFALFPSLMKRMPRSGRWMSMVKVTLGVLEIAFALKFLSTADMAYGWRIISPTIFLIIWGLLFGALTIYIIYSLRKSLFVVCAILPLLLTAYIVRGLCGGDTTLLAAFLPPETTTVNDEGIIISNDYDEGLALARKEKKMVLLDFSGYGCVNCRKMESTVLRDKRVINTIAKNYVVVRLFVDDRKQLPQPIVVNWSGKQRIINTFGEKWSHLESETFKSIAQPFYVILSEKGERISTPFGYDEDTERFLKWLNTRE